MASARWGAMEHAEAPEGASDERLPRGKHLVQIKKVLAKETSTGKSMWSILFEAIEGPLAGAVAWTNITYSPESPAALFFFERDMETLGLPKSWFQEADPTDEEVKDALESNDVVVYITVGADKNDKTRDVVNRIDSATEGATSSPLPPTTPKAKPSVSVPTKKVTPPTPANSRPRTPFDN
jgi:hypothetical protein